MTGVGLELKVCFLVWHWGKNRSGPNGEASPAAAWQSALGKKKPPRTNGRALQS